MPDSIIEAGLADLVLPPTELGAHVSGLASIAPYAEDRPVASTLSELRESLPDLLELIHAHTGFNFSNYKTATLERRVLNRMAQVCIGSFADYISYIGNQPDELEELQRSFLISVTEFFRDAWAFSEMRKLIESFCNSSEKSDPIRVWVTGCATGEEAYSVAMLFAEALGGQLRNRDVKIFATDIDDLALNVARRGVYPQSTLNSIQITQMRRYFEEHGSSVRVRREIRELVVFAHHDLLKDPPFLRVNLICCRNLLIYLNARQQRELIAKFYFALQPGHYLFLGRAESTGADGELMFDTVDMRARIFRRRRESVSAQMAIGMTGSHVFPAKSYSDDGSNFCVQLLASTYLPPSVRLNDQFRPIETYGPMAEFMNADKTGFRQGIAVLVTPAYKDTLRTLINETERTNERQMRSAPVIDPVTGRLVTLVMRRFNQPDSVEYILSFEVSKGFERADSGITVSPETAIPALNTSLAEEVEHQIALLQQRTEELESCSEELDMLQSQHRTLSTELKSTIRELEYSNGILQSSVELIEAKIDALDVDQEKLLVIFKALDIACLLVDDQLTIAAITPPAMELFGTDRNALRRKVSELNHQLPVADLEALVAEVIRTGLAVRENLAGTTPPQQLFISPTLNRAGRAIGAAVMVQRQAA